MDLHLENAKRIFDTEDPTPEQRQQAKSDAFFRLYGGSQERFLARTAPKRTEYKFDFCVADCTLTQADELLDEIIDLVEAKDLWMGGGCAPYTRWNCVCDSIEIKLMSFLARWLKPVWKWLNQPYAEDSDG